MAVSVWRQERNLIRSVFLHIAVNFEQANSLDGKVSYSDSEFTSDSKDEWVFIEFPNFGMGRKGAAILQADFYVRTARGRGANADRFGDRCAQIAEQFHDAMHTRTIDIYNFAVPASPVLITDQRILVQNNAGVFGEPTDSRIWNDYQDGLARRTLSYRLVLPTDLSGIRQYYD